MAKDDRFDKAVAYCHNDKSKLLSLYMNKCLKLRAEILRLSAEVSNLKSRHRLEYADNYPFIAFKFDEKKGRLIYLRACNTLADFDTLTDVSNKDALVYVPLSEFKAFTPQCESRFNQNYLK